MAIVNRATIVTKELTHSKLIKCGTVGEALREIMVEKSASIKEIRLISLSVGEKQ